MAKAAQAKELNAAFEKHETETEGHVERLEKVFEEIDDAPRGKTCDAIMGIIEEGQEVMKEYKGTPALTPALLAAAQAVEHYEMSRYGSSRPGPRNSASANPLNFSTLPWRKKRKPTRR